ncbi:MAG: M48 family metallopeptidase [Planctomycetota bacterium]
MRFLPHVVLALVIQSAGQWMQTGEHLPARWAPLLALLPYGLMALARRVGVAGQFILATWLRRVAELSGVLAYAICVFAMGWVDVVRRKTGQPLEFEAWPEWGLFLTFAPFLVYQLAAVHAESIALRGIGARMWSTMRFQVRMLAATLAPFALYLAISVLFARSETLRVHIESVRLIEGLYFGFLLVLFSGLMPALLSSTWETDPLPPGQARDIFHELSQRAEFQSREVLLWNTGDTMPNAAIVGVSPRSRVVLLSDSLLAMLGPRELACVYAHEIGHSKRHHVWIFIGWTATFLLTGMLVSEWLAPHSEMAAVTVVGAAMFAWYLCFGWLSRRLELEADLYSMQLTGDPDALIQALDRVGGSNRERGGWRHFSTSRRVRFLHRCAFDEVFRLRFLQRIRLLGRLGIVLGFVALLGYGAWTVREFGQDRLRARLSLGSYSSEWANGSAVDKDWADLLPVAAGLANEDGSRVPSERVASALQDALLAGQGESSQHLARLLALRGDRGAALLVRWMHVHDWPPAPGEDLADWPHPWRDYALSGFGLDEDVESPGE